MKQIIHKLTLLIVLLSATTPAYAERTVIDGIYYDLNESNNTARVMYQHVDEYGRGYSDYSGEVVIPETITYNETTYSVTAIGSYAFCRSKGLTVITIPSSVISIEKSAFEYCTGLTTVTIPNSVTYIGESAFNDCSGLTSVTFNAEKCTKMGPYYYPVFKGCTGLTSLTIGEKVTTIPGCAFYGCSGLTFVTIPNSVTTIGDSAFYGCSGLTSVTIPNSVTTIGDSAFYGCSGLTSVTIPNSVTTIGDSAFCNCNRLHSLIIGTGVLSIGKYAIGFHRDYYNNSYKPSPVEKIIWLTNTPPNGYHGVNAEANYVANSLYTRLSNIYEYKYLSSYFEVDGIRYVPVSPSERTCDAIDCTYNPEQTDISLCKTVSYKGVSMTLKDIKPYTCYNNTHITKVIINYEGNIGNYAFSQSATKNEATFKISANTIGESTFKGCSAIVSADITAESIGDYAFFQSATKNEATFKISANTIGESTFKGCSAIVSADITAESIGDYAFFQSATKNEATFKIVAKTIGKEAFSDCSKMTKATLGESLTSIRESAFSGCSSLEGVTIPNNVESIGSYAFEKCSAMTYAKIGSGLKTIPYSTFSSCSSLPSITISKNVTQIGGFAFSGCKSLADLYIEDREDELGLGSNGSSPLFSGCPLKTVYIGGNITYPTSSSSGYSPFYRNTSLEKVIITDKETEISDNEFYGCTGLKYITMGDGIEKIGDWAFSGCSSLDFFRVGSNVKAIGKEAFSDCTAMTKLITTAPVPPTCGSQALDDINKWTCELFVNKESIDQYKAAEQWKEFFFISEYDGVDDVSVDTLDAVYEVYNLQGVRVGSGMREAEVTADALPHGVYILVSPQGRKKLKI